MTFMHANPHTPGLPHSGELLRSRDQPLGTERAPLVLVVDDFDDNRVMYAEYLSRCGYDIDQAADGREAIDLARERLPDVIVMDLSLPVIDGWEATRQLKADERTRRIAIIALTGYSASGLPREAREVGCDAFLEKPCLPELLAEKVEQLMRDR
jgi:two-component system cell cycle response regulator DivK